MTVLTVIPWDDAAELVIFTDGTLALDTGPIPFELAE